MTRSRSYSGYDALGQAVSWDHGGGDKEEVQRDADGNVVGRRFGVHAIEIRPDALGNVRSVKGRPGGGVETTVATTRWDGGPTSGTRSWGRASSFATTTPSGA